MPTLVLSESTMNVLARVVVHFLWQGALLGLAAACLLYVSPIRTARARYGFFCGLLLLLAICPLVTWCGISGGSVAVSEFAGEPTDEARDVASFVEAEPPVAEPVSMQSITGSQDVSLSTLWPSDAHMSGHWLARQRGLIVTAWLAGICVMGARLLLGVIGVRALTRQTKPLPPNLTNVAERISRQLAFQVHPAVHVVERISQAMAVGIVKPMVLLPATWICELPGDVLEAVIAHELAHLRRWDLPINFLQRVVESMLFFHPVVWWCSRRLRAEREMCCDELAQAAIGNRVVYAKALAFLAHRQCSALESLLVAGIGGSKMVLLERIRNVLGITPGYHGRLYGPSCALVGAVVASLGWIAATGLPSSWKAETSPPHAGATMENQLATTAEPAAEAQAAIANLSDLAADLSPPPSDGAATKEPLTLENLKFQNYRDLTLDEALKKAIANSKVLRSLEGAWRKSSPEDDAGRTDLEDGMVDYELAVRNLHTDVDAAYWELAFTWRNLEIANTALNSARQTWQKIYASYRVGNKGGEASAEAQTREQFYQFKTQAQTMLNELCRAESKLRYMMGLAASDGQFIRPIDRPRADKVKLDWLRLTQEALAHNPDLRRQRSRVKRQELELIATTQMLPRDLRRNGMPGDSLFQEWALGSQAIIPVGLREKLATLRGEQLKLTRERAKLQDEELEVSHQLADAVRQLEYNYQLSQTNMTRALAADRQVEAMQASFDGESGTLDQLLEAQRRRAEAQTSYYRTLHDYQRAILMVQYRRGSLL